MNRIGNSYFDKKNRYGNVEINGYNIAIFLEVDGYKKDNFTPRYSYSVRVANDWNMSNRFQIKARTMRSLLAKLAKHQYKLVK